MKNWFMTKKSSKPYAKRFQQLERPMPEINLRQCYRPKNAEILKNPYGTAPGLFSAKGGKNLSHASWTRSGDASDV